MRSSKHQEDFGHVLGNQNRSRVSSFIRPQNTRRGTNLTVLGGTENVVEACCFFIRSPRKVLNQTTITV